MVRKKQDIWVALTMLGMIVGVFFGTHALTVAFDDRLSADIVGRVSAGLESEEQHVLQQSQEMVSAGNITQYANRTDILKLLEVVDQAKKARNLDEIIVTNNA